MRPARIQYYFANHQNENEESYVSAIYIWRSS